LGIIFIAGEHLKGHLRAFLELELDKEKKAGFGYILPDGTDSWCVARPPTLGDIPILDGNAIL
jgi:hypothetical protein